jgi:hypothetical protein
MPVMVIGMVMAVRRSQRHRRTHRKVLLFKEAVGIMYYS